MKQRSSTTYGFSRAASLMQTRIRKASESRGFAVSRLLTHWADIVGEDVARIAQPVKVGYGRGGLGASLTVLTTGANAPVLGMQVETIRAKVNACYGYNAISRVHITQTAPTGFADGQAMFTPAPKSATKAPDPVIKKQAQDMAKDVENDELRQALAALATNVMTKNRRQQ